MKPEEYLEDKGEKWGSFSKEEKNEWPENWGSWDSVTSNEETASKTGGSGQHVKAEGVDQRKA